MTFAKSFRTFAIIAFITVCTSCSNSNRFNANVCILDPEDFYPEIAVDAVEQRLEQSGKLPQRFEIRIREINKRRFEVFIRPWPPDGRSITGFVAVNDGKPFIDKVVFTGD